MAGRYARSAPQMRRRVEAAIRELELVIKEGGYLPRVIERLEGLLHYLRETAK